MYIYKFIKCVFCYCWINIKLDIWLFCGNVVIISVLLVWYMEKDEVGVWFLKGRRIL